MKIEVSKVEHFLTSFDLGDVENIVDQTQQVLAAVADGLQRSAMVFGQIGCAFHNLGKSQDRVHRGSDLVTHIRQKLGLGLVRCRGLFRVALRFFFGRPDLLFSLLAPRKVIQHRQNDRSTLQMTQSQADLCREFLAIRLAVRPFEPVRSLGAGNCPHL